MPRGVAGAGRLIVRGRPALLMVMVMGIRCDGVHRVRVRFPVATARAVQHSDERRRALKRQDEEYREQRKRTEPGQHGARVYTGPANMQEGEYVGASGSRLTHPGRAGAATEHAPGRKSGIAPGTLSPPGVRHYNRSTPFISPEATMTYKCLLTDVEERIATLTLNRPERLNALGDTLREDLLDAIVKLGADPEVRVLIITGAGRGFCSGGDVKSMSERDQAAHVPSPVERYAPLRDRIILAMRDCPKPVIAAVNGPAAGAGMNLALACDLRVASSAAKFSQAFVKRGLHPDWGGTYFLPRVVGTAKACELIFTGETIDASRALELGLVNAVVAPEALLSETRKLALRIADGPPVAIALAKRAIYHNQDVDLRSALEFETFAQNVTRETEDAKEGVRAFIEKRAPVFRGR
jgi:enoyl-CoA hydratase/carnithine racemase